MSAYVRFFTDNPKSNHLAIAPSGRRIVASTLFKNRVELCMDDTDIRTPAETEEAHRPCGVAGVLKAVFHREEIAVRPDPCPPEEPTNYAHCSVLGEIPRSKRNALARASRVLFPFPGIAMENVDGTLLGADYPAP